MTTQFKFRILRSVGISKRSMANKPMVKMLLSVIAKFTINSNICFFSQIRAHGSLLSSKFSKPAVVKTCPGFWHHQLASVYLYSRVLLATSLYGPLSHTGL